MTRFHIYCFRRLIYFCWSVRTSFRIFCVTVKLLFQSVQFWKIYDKMILQSTSEALIRFLTGTFITLIIRVAWIERLFHIDLMISLLFEAFIQLGVNLHSYWTSIEKHLPSLYLLLNCSNSNNPFLRHILIMSFDQQTFLLYSILLGGLLSEHSTFHFDGNWIRKCTLIDIQSNHFPLNSSKF